MPEIENNIFSELSAYEIALVCFLTKHSMSEHMTTKWLDPIRDVFRDLKKLDSLIKEGFGITVYGQDLVTIRRRAIDIASYLRHHDASRPLFVTVIITSAKHEIDDPNVHSDLCRQDKSRTQEVFNDIVGDEFRMMKKDTDSTVFAIVLLSCALVRCYDTESALLKGVWSLAVSRLDYLRGNVSGSRSVIRNLSQSDITRRRACHAVQYINVHQDHELRMYNKSCGPSRIRLELVQEALDETYYETRFRGGSNFFLQKYFMLDADRVDVNQWVPIPLRPLKPVTK